MAPDDLPTGHAAPTDEAAAPDGPAPSNAPTTAADDRALVAMAEEATGGIVAEFWAFLGQNKKWWLTPILLALLIVGALIVFGASTAGPFVYTLF